MTNSPLSYGILTDAISSPGPLIMEILTCHYENLDRSTWKSRPLIMKILTVHHENLNWSTWKPPPFIMKILTIHHENLNRSNINRHGGREGIFQILLAFFNQFTQSKFLFVWIIVLSTSWEFSSTTHCHYISYEMLTIYCGYSPCI